MYQPKVNGVTVRKPFFIFSLICIIKNPVSLFLMKWRTTCIHFLFLKYLMSSGKAGGNVYYPHTILMLFSQNMSTKSFIWNLSKMVLFLKIECQ